MKIAKQTIGVLTKCDGLTDEQRMLDPDDINSLESKVKQLDIKNYKELSASLLDVGDDEPSAYVATSNKPPRVEPGKKRSRFRFNLANSDLSDLAKSEKKWFEENE